MSIYLCVDCGGSKTSAVICNASGSIIGRASGGPSNFAYLGLDAFTSAIRESVSQALMACVSPPSSEPVPLPPPIPITAAWFGVSGVDSPAAIATITPVLSALLGIPSGPRLIIANDTHLLAAPIRLRKDVSCAVAVVGGTGSISVSFREKDGVLEELGRIGGWGWILGDEGGGFNVGREAVRQILLENDKASVSGEPLPDSPLRKRVMEHFGISEVLEILTVVHLPDPSPSATFPQDALPHLITPREKRLSSLSPFVFQAAFEDGDPLALSVLQTCAEVLASQIALLLTEDSSTSSKAVIAQDSLISFGGSLVGIPAYRKLILDLLAKQGHTFRYVEFIDDAATVGAKGLAAAYSQMSTS